MLALLVVQEVRTVVADLAERLFETGEQILASGSRFCTSPLELHCLTQRLRLAEPTCHSGDKRRDLGHVLDFVSQLQHLEVVAEPGCLATSDLSPSGLPFDLAPFRCLQTLSPIPVVRVLPSALLRAVWLSHGRRRGNCHGS
ncbi:hypothetical protein V5799_022289 [Amblyomma americanum]|uniref:Uncharacterized protein n=1 Tax=Amblyomma americanum TaxID=6943 RepID=A0AAQ4FMI9_AMBAM